MACPFVRHSDSVTRQPSTSVAITDQPTDDDLTEIADSLTLTHLQSAIQLLTSPSVGLALSSASLATRSTNDGFSENHFFALFSLSLASESGCAHGSLVPG